MKRQIPVLLYFILGNMLMAILVVVILYVTILKPLAMQNADEHLSQDLQSIATSLDARFEEKINALASLKSYIETTYDPEKLRYNDAKITDYANSLEPHLLQMAFGFEDAYVVFLKSYFGYYHDRWYFDANNDGIPEKMKELTEDYFDGNQLSKAWYYKPISVKRPVWIGPYESTALKGTFFITYTTLIQKSSEPVMLIGIDFEFTEFRNLIASYTKIPSAHLYLLNENKQIIVSSTDANSTKENSHSQQDTLLFASEIASQQVLRMGEFQYNDAQNELRLGKFIPLKNGWYLGLTVNENILLSSMAQQTHSIIVLFILWAFLSVVLCIIFYKYLSLWLSKMHLKEQLRLTNQIKVLESNIQNNKMIIDQSTSKKIDVLERELIQIEKLLNLHKVNEHTLKSRIVLMTHAIPLSSQSLKLMIETAPSQIATFSIKSILNDVSHLYKEAYPDYQCQVIVSLEQDFYVHSRKDFYHTIFSAVFELFYTVHFDPFEHYFVKVTLAHPKNFLNISFENDGKINLKQIETYANIGFETQLQILEQIDLPLYLLHDLVVNELSGSLQYDAHSNRNGIHMQIPL